MIDTIYDKLISGAKLDKEEDEVATYLERCCKDDLYPRGTSREQIIKMIRLAYQDAWKRQERKTQPTDIDRDRKAIPETRYKTVQKFQGECGRFIIEFYFSFTDMIIETAYPKHNLDQNN